MKLNAVLMTTLCTVAIPFLAHAETAVKPLVLEELPPAAILRINRPSEGTYLLADGREMSFAKDKRAVEIRKFAQIQRIELPAAASYIGQRAKSVVQVHGTYDQGLGGYNSYFVHLATGRVHAKAASEKAYLSSVGDSAILISESSYEVIDERTGDLRLLKARGNSQQGITYSSTRTSMGQIITVEGMIYLVTENNEWKLIPVPAGVTYCGEQDDKGVLECGSSGNSNLRYVIYPHANSYITWDSTGKSVLAFNRERHEAIWVNEITSPDVKLVATMNRTRLDTGATTQIKFRDLDPTNTLDFFFKIGGDSTILWFKNKDLEVVSNTAFWSAFDSKKLHILKGQGRKLGNARSMADLGPLLQNEYSRLNLSRADKDWQIGVNDGVLTYGRAGVASVNRVFLGSNPSISVIPRTSFAHLQFRVGSNSFNVLFNMELGRAFELGASYADLESSPRGDQVLMSRGTEQWLIGLGLTNQNMNWRSAPSQPLPHGELSEDILGSCTTPELPQEQGIAAALLRLRQMPGGRVDEHDLRYLLGYQLNQSELILIAHVIQKNLAAKPEETILAFRRLRLAEKFQALRAGFTASPCLSQSDRTALQQHIARLFKENNDQELVGTDIYSYQHLIALQPLVREFGFANENSEHIMVDKMARAALLHPQLQGVFQSKLYYFSKAALGPIFGRTVKFKTDVTVNQDKKISHVTLISSVPAYGQPVRRNSFGFYHGVISSMEVQGNVGQKTTQRLEWRAIGQKFAADVTLTKSGDLSHLVPKAPSVDYSSMNQDKKLVGMMVVGTNLGHTYSEMTMDQYESFYRARNYVFGAPTQISNSLKFMEAQITSGELDYLVKEAHSDGDERNLFRAARIGELRTGRRHHPKTGREEVVYLLSPKYGANGSMVSGQDGADDLIPNQLFGEWVREREKVGRGPLVYLNASCSSATKVVNEITSTRSKLLVAIPSVTAISMFRNRNSNSTAVFIDGLHEGLDWAQIRQRMEVDPEVKEERNNLFALPNEERFDRSIRQSLGFTVDADVRLMDLKANRSFSVDEFNRDH